MNIEELISKLDEIESDLKSCGKSLEEYWRSMYLLTEKNKKEKPTLELFFKMIRESISNPPIEFDQKWLCSISPPESNIFEDDVKKGDKELISENEGINFFKKVLEFQISELHKMKDKQLKNEHRYFGVDSETGNRWFNFDPVSILDSGLSGMESNGFNEDLESWIFLGEIIEMGRVFE